MNDIGPTLWLLGSLTSQVKDFLSKPNSSYPGTCHQLKWHLFWIQKFKYPLLLDVRILPTSLLFQLFPLSLPIGLIRPLIQTIIVLRKKIKVVNKIAKNLCPGGTINSILSSHPFIPYSTSISWSGIPITHLTMFLKTCPLSFCPLP